MWSIFEVRKNERKQSASTTIMHVGSIPAVQVLPSLKNLVFLMLDIIYVIRSIKIYRYGQYDMKSVAYRIIY